MILLSSIPANAQVANFTPQELEKIDVIEHLGETIPLDITFTNDKGETFQLGDYFYQGKPVIIVLAYYNCPMLCSLVLNGLSAAAKQIDFKPPQDYTILTISIDPTETFELAAAKKKNYIEALGIEGADAGWHFCVGDSASSRTLADALGFQYYWDDKQEQWAHPAVLHFLSPDGMITRYLYGLSYKQQDLRLSLLEASQGRIGTTIDKIILYCFHYDPDSKGYVVFAGNVMRIGGLITVLLLAIFLGILFIRYRVINPLNSSN
jgi:protein SCO1/2